MVTDALWYDIKISRRQVVSGRTDSLNNNKGETKEAKETNDWERK